MPSDRIFLHKPNGLHYFHLKQLKHITEWQLTGTLKEQKKTQGEEKDTLRLLLTFFGLALDAF